MMEEDAPLPDSLAEVKYHLAGTILASPLTLGLPSLYGAEKLG